jgi:ubiquinone/menaquinone biosynthesis C-methylase UbiE
VFDHNEGWKSKATAKSYDARRFKSLGGRLYDYMEKRAIAKLLDLAESKTPIRTVLDLPCGTGRITELLLRRGYQTTCGDISEEMIEVARQRLAPFEDRIEEFAIMDVYNTRRKADSYDCVSCIRLFQHLVSSQRANALREMARISKRFVIINVMYVSPYYSAVRKLRLRLGRYTTRYTSSQNEIAEELRVAGVRLVGSKLTQPGFNGNLVLLLEKTS